MESLALQLFFILLISGLILIGAEIFVPGGILGSMGALSLVAAIMVGFKAFPRGGPYVALGILFLAGTAFILWIKIFPGTRIGKSMTVSNDMADAKATESEAAALIGKSGVATSALHPGGYAEIEGERVDVVSEGGMIAKGTAVRVIEVEGNRIVVESIDGGQAAADKG